MFAILGSGFGLYGYLPALADEGEAVVLPERYRTHFESRQELMRFARTVRWARNESEALDCADGVTIALRPADQRDWISVCVARSNIKRLILEKPLAPNPDLALSVLNTLALSKKVFCVGYTFRHTSWAQRLSLGFGDKSALRLDINWSFFAHHYRNKLRNWKRFGESGGGAIRFYGIQIIALLAGFGYRNVGHSEGFGATPNEIERWSASFTGENLPACHVEVNTRTDSDNFAINLRSPMGRVSLVNYKDPFDGNETRSGMGMSDRRVGILKQVYRSLREESTEAIALNVATIALWRQCETIMRFEKTTSIDS